jgi:pilus assembly protein CpaB
MKNSRALVMLLVSIVIGVIVTVLAVGFVSQKGAVASNKVVVAAIDIELGSRLNPQMLTTVDWPADSVPTGASTDPKEMTDRVVRTSVQRGEPILATKLAPVGTLGGLSAVIADGKRAMTVRVNDVVGVAGFALPGNYVDVMINTQQDKVAKTGDEKVQISRTVLEHVLVLAVAQEAGRDDTKPRVVNAVTLELTTDDAERLDLARNVGTLSLVLRNQSDKQPVVTAGITKKQLFREADEPVVKVETIKPVYQSAPRVRAIPVAAVATNCVEVVQNNVRAINCF